jgi:hypothetical protein
VIGATNLLDDAERAEILLALLRVHERRTDEQGCLRALAGLNSAFPGGVEKLARLVPGGQAESVRRPAVRSALRLAEKDFLATFHARVVR